MYGRVGVYSLALATRPYRQYKYNNSFLIYQNYFNFFIFFFECRQLSVVGTKLNAYLCCINLK